MNKKRFEKMKNESPDSRIGKRDWGYQKARDELASALRAEKSNDRIGRGNKLLKSLKLKKDISVEEAKKNYYLQKIFSQDCRVMENDRFKLVLDEDFKEYIGSLSKESLQSFADSIHDDLKSIAAGIIYMSDFCEDDPSDDMIAPFFTGNKLLDYIAENRPDVKVEKVIISTTHTYVEI